MAWRVHSRTDPGRWVAWDGRSWTADAQSRLEMLTLLDGPQPITSTGPYYEPTGPDDPVAVYVCAMRIVAAPQVDGEAPTVVRGRGGANPGAVH